MSSSDYTKKINELREKVSQYTQLPKQKYNVLPNIDISTENNPKFNKKYLLYLIPPILILIILIISKPSFITEDSIDKKNVITKKIKYKSLLIFVLIGSISIYIGIFVYFKKKTK
jgi:hypothetical protein